MSTFLISVGIGLATAAILALSAVAFTLEYAVSRVANFAHGELLTIGAYAAYSGQRLFHQNVAAAALLAAGAGLVAGLAMNAGLIEQFRGRTATTVFIATLGRLAGAAEPDRDDLRRRERLLLLHPGRPAPRRAVPVDHLQHRGDHLGPGRRRAHLPAAAAHQVRQGHQGRVPGPDAGPGERHPRAPGRDGHLGARRGDRRLRGLHPRRHDRHLRPAARVQLPAAHDHRHGGRRASGGPTPRWAARCWSGW